LDSLIPLLLAVPLVLLAVWLVFLKPPDYDRWGLPTGAVSYESLRTHPEATLTYPGPGTMPGASSMSAQVDHTLIEFGHPYHNLVANSAMTLFTPDSLAQVHTWYDRWLRAHGWRRVVVPTGAPTILSQRLYDRGTREEYSIAFSKGSSRSGQRQFATRYSIKPYGQQ